LNYVTVVGKADPAAAAAAVDEFVDVHVSLGIFTQACEAKLGEWQASCAEGQKLFSLRGYYHALTMLEEIPNISIRLQGYVRNPEDVFINYDGRKQTYKSRTAPGKEQAVILSDHMMRIMVIKDEGRIMTERQKTCLAELGLNFSL
jgi:hypothetical protein